MVQSISRDNPSVAWCVTVIRNAASRAKSKQTRYSKNEILCLNNPNEDGIEMVEMYNSEVAEAEFALSDLSNLLSLLPKIQFLIMYKLFVLLETQTEIAKKLNISQQQVSRLKVRAIKKIRTELTRYE